MRVSVPVSPTNAMVTDERGAVAVFVAVTSLVFFAMLALAVDIGSVVVLRRNLVRAADSAALAAAQSCATRAPEQAETQADHYATANQSDASGGITVSTGCGTAEGSVTVEYSAVSELQIAGGLLDIDDPTIDATATAIWGPAGGGTAVPPIALMIDGSGEVPCDPSPATCGFWQNNNDSGFSGGSVWGLMNLDTWGGQNNSSNCGPAGVPEIEEFITNSPALTIIDNPTSVCIAHGHRTNVWFDALTGIIGQVRDFSLYSGEAATDSDRYPVVALVRMRIVDVLEGDDPAAVGVEGITDAECSVTLDFNLTETLDLDTIPDCDRAADEPFTNLEITARQRGETMSFTSPPDYLLNPLTNEITWMTLPEDNVTVSFTWSRDGEPGACGIHAPDPNGVCLVLSHIPSVGGSNPGGGAGVNGALQAIRLDS